jgi:hypothetical protein
MNAVVSNKKSAPTLSKQVEAKLAELTSTASKVRYLDGEGFPRGDIARILNIRYQWVRNVLITPLKKA